MSPIHSNKNIVDSEGQLAVGTDSVTNFVSVIAPGGQVTTVDSVPSGANINGVFISLFLIGSTGSVVPVALDWYVGVLRAGQSAITDFPTPGATGMSNVRNQIIHEEKGLSGTQDGTPMAFKGVVAIPRVYRRMREGTQLFIRIKGVADVAFCVKVLYKYFN